VTGSSRLVDEIERELPGVWNAGAGRPSKSKKMDRSFISVLRLLCATHFTFSVSKVIHMEVISCRSRLSLKKSDCSSQKRDAMKLKGRDELLVVVKDGVTVMMPKLESYRSAIAV